MVLVGEGRPKYNKAFRRTRRTRRADLRDKSVRNENFLCLLTASGTFVLLLSTPRAMMLVADLLARCIYAPQIFSGILPLLPSVKRVWRRFIVESRLVGDKREPQTLKLASCWNPTATPGVQLTTSMSIERRLPAWDLLAEDLKPVYGENLPICSIPARQLNNRGFLCHSSRTLPNFGVAFSTSAAANISNPPEEEPAGGGTNTDKAGVTLMSTELFVCVCV